MDHQASTSDPVSSGQQKISQEDLRVMRDKFPMLNDFSEHFLQSRTLDELLRIESTSLRIRDAERAREAEERLAQNWYTGMFFHIQSIPSAHLLYCYFIHHRGCMLEG